MMRDTKRIAARSIVAALLIATACTTGCTTIYHVMLHEMAKSDEELIASRMTAARDNHASARKAFEAAFANARAVEGAADRDKAHLRLRQSLNRVELETWNVQRRIASLRDVADIHVESLSAGKDPRGQSEFTRSYWETIERMQQSHDEMALAIDGLRQQAVILGADGDPAAARMLQPVAYLSRTDQEAFLAGIDEAISKADAVIAMLSGDRPAATDRARDRAAAR